MQVADVMTANPQSASSQDSLKDVAERMNAGNFGSMPVLENDAVVGVVTDRDIAVRGVARGLTPDQPVSQVMSPDAICVASDCSVADAAKLMQERQVRRLYVTGENGLAGVVSLGDVALQSSEDLSGQTLEQISKD